MRHRTAFLALLPLALAAACAPDAPSGPRGTPAAHTDLPGISRGSALVYPYRSQLRADAAGLLYMSESDYPFEYVSRPAFLRDTLTVASFRYVFGVAPSTPVDVRSLDRFFGPQTTGVDPADPVGVALAPRFQKLEDDLREFFDAPKAYCVGTVQLRCYVVGTTTEGVVAGVATTAIET